MEAQVNFFWINEHFLDGWGETLYVCAKKYESRVDYDSLALKIMNWWLRSLGVVQAFNPFGAQFPYLKTEVTVCSNMVPEGPVCPFGCHMLWVAMWLWAKQLSVRRMPQGRSHMVRITLSTRFDQPWPPIISHNFRQPSWVSASWATPRCCCGKRPLDLLIN